MYPWHETLSTWTDSLNFKIDALGLLTLLGTEEMETSIGRLVLNPYLNYLPLLGVFVISTNSFTTRKTGFELYNLSAGIKTNEFAGWFSRWLQSQDFHNVRSIVTWDETHRRPSHWVSFFVGSFLIGLPFNGFLIALTILAADWWGFANTIAMITLTVVKCVLVSQNQAGIDANIRNAREAQVKLAAHASTREMAKVIIITDNSQAVTVIAPAYLIRPIFTAHPKIPNPRLYRILRMIAWVACAAHVICIGMAALYTQIVTVVIIISATVLTANKVGCEDSHLWRIVKEKFSPFERDQDGKPAEQTSCWVSSTLRATISLYPADYTEWEETQPSKEVATSSTISELPRPESNRRKFWRRQRSVSDIKTNVIAERVIPGRRQDLYVWLLLSAKEESCLQAWGMIPHDQKWMGVYLKKKDIHRRRVERAHHTAEV